MLSCYRKPLMITSTVLAAVALLAAGHQIINRRLGRGQPAEDSPAASPAMSSAIVDVVGREFEWHCRYPGADAIFGTEDDIWEARRLYLPTNTDVQLRVTSEDYIYTLSLPAFGATEMAVPGLTHTLQFRTGGEGEYELPADPMCGLRLLHDELMGTVVVQEPSDVRYRFGKGS